MKPHYRILRLNHGRAPTVQHATLKEAETEALRLAGQHPGETFEILLVLGIARATEPSIFWNDSVEPLAESVRYPTTPLPEGFDRWECRGFGWSAGHAVFTTGYDGYDPHWDERSTTGNTAAYPALEYWEAVKDEPSYRILELGEIIADGDEYQECDGQWYPWFYSANTPVSESTPLTRRPTKKP